MKILLNILTSKAALSLAVRVAELLAKRSDNDIDDLAVSLFKKELEKKR